ncbi:peptidylprolyl isomerase [Geothrix limicola]|uniref:Peptidylprolyl isomerase n=1 Tax=Geothrix limicola TaxID=2927978 RepID=A0ABQ5QJT4_9BACT|nr:peptidylprolyl isomerase [Geothrix limicola]GLH74578.1 peptidylprolyl isomerase [Geothrix limicola]
MFRTPLLSLLTTLLVGQTPAVAPAHGKAPAAPAKATKAADPAKATKEDAVIAKLGKSVIRQSDFDTFVRVVFNEQQRQQINATPGVLDRVKTSYLDSLVMAAKARKDGLNKGADVKKQVELAEIRVLATALAEQSKDELKKRAEVNDEELKTFYDKNHEQFQSKPSFNARHILIAVKGSQPGSDKGLSDEEAKAKAEKVQAELAAGKPWQDLAKQYSDDPGSKDKGGLYENVPYGRFVPAFDEAVRKQELGKPGAPVKSTFGYHVIQVEKRIDAELQPFDKVKEQIRQRLTATKMEDARKAFMDECRKAVGFVEVPAAPKDGPKPAPAPKAER